MSKTKSNSGAIPNPGMRKENPSIHWHDWWFNKILMMVVFVGDVVLASQQRNENSEGPPGEILCDVGIRQSSHRALHYDNVRNLCSLNNDLVMPFKSEFCSANSICAHVIQNDLLYCAVLNSRK